MKRLSLMFFAVAVIGFAFLGVSQVQAETTGNIAVTVSLGSSVSVVLTGTNASTWAIGPLALSAESTMADTVTATVGNVATKLTIAATSPAAGGWTIGATVGLNTFKVTVISPALTLTTSASDSVLSDSVAPYQTKGFKLKYSMPSSDDKGGTVGQGFTVTVTAEAVS